jgi:hypothetical protein
MLPGAMRRATTTLVLAGLLAVSVSGACGHGRTLVARSGDHRLTARDAKSGVSVILTTDVWQGVPEELDEELTIVHVLVANMGDEPILLAPGDLEFRDLRGFRYDLFDPGATFRPSAEPTPEEPFEVSAHPDYDRGLTDDFIVTPPIGEMAERALPWGVLEPGTQMRGYLYFESVARAANGATLTWHFGTPDHRPVVDTVFELYLARAE